MSKQTRDVLIIAYRVVDRVQQSLIIVTIAYALTLLIYLPDAL